MYHLTKYQCELLAMALSGEARIRVLDRLYEMEQNKLENPTQSLDSMRAMIDSIDIMNNDAVENVMF
jgi:hypothetical protein